MSSTRSTPTSSSIGSTQTGTGAANYDMFVRPILNFQSVPAAHRRHELCSHQLEVPLVPHHAGDLRPGEAHGPAVLHNQGLNHYVIAMTI